MENTHTAKVTPKDFFLYLGVLVSLYWSAGSLLALLFEIVNRVITDPLNDTYYYYAGFDSGMRFAIASLIIIFPVYLILSRMIANTVRREPGKRGMWVRTCFLYLTLFAAGAVVVGDLVALVNSFLGGELTTRFILKALAVLVVAAAVFAYYLYQMRTDGGNSRTGQLLIGGALVGVIAALVGGFMVLGTPAEQRDMRFDQERVNDLENIQWQVTDYYRNKGVLPQTLDEVGGSLGVSEIPVDPETGAPYAYSRTAPLSFELCAIFSAPSPQQNTSYVRDAVPVGFKGDTTWNHGEGEECFSRTIDPDYFTLRR